MDLSKFFDAVRSSLFGGRLSQPAVDGLSAIIASAERNRVTDVRHVANIMAQVHHETGGYMLPVKETVYPSSKDKNPTDEAVKKRLDAAFAKGQLTWVKTPYWRDGYFGRGQIQLTHKANYQKMGARLGVDLVSNPALALDKDIGADIAVVGMAEGLFTGRKLSDYFNATKNDPAGARRIVNGPDGTDAKIAANHGKFLAALKAAGFGTASQAIILPEPEIIAPEPYMPPVVVTPIPSEPVIAAPSPIEQASKSVGAAKGAAQGSVVAGALVTLTLAFGWLPQEMNTAEVGAAMGVLLTGMFSIVQAAVGAYMAKPNASPH